MAIGERVLMGPGPSNVYPEVVAALGRPVLGHLDPEFLQLLDETCERLRTVFRTTSRLTIPVSGTGSAGMEAALVNVVHRGDVVVVGINGLFGERMADIADRQGAEVVRVEAPWGEPLEPGAVLGAHPNPAVIALVHAETSTGVRNDVQAVCRGKGDALVVADTVTSLGGIELDVDGWGIDVAYSGTQKCLGVPPGLAPLTMGERAWSRRVDRPASWYLDLGLIAGYVDGTSGRTYHHTAPVSMVFALHAGLGVLLEEGLEHCWRRHAQCGQALHDGLEAMGLELVAPEDHRLPQLTTVRVPEGLPAQTGEAAVRRALLERYGIEIGAGVG
ncbi:MAG TPA: alanine--glyoxylate aminotransferase family protein, partial [Acidimicrobiales bacterium]|nr:alanine--glyoxylate aminotransferase family protein [Acidimicrobiales bacterium]